MPEARAEAVSRYQAWAKLRSAARFDLAVSGIKSGDLEEIF
jgi:hypothetical protein